MYMLLLKGPGWRDSPVVKEYSALAEDPCSVPTSTCWLTTVVPGDLMSSSDHLGLLYRHYTHSYIQAYTYTHTI